MDKQLIVNNKITIHAPVSAVWNILVKPQFIKQWDDLPEDYTDQSNLKLGSEILWIHEDGEYTKLTVIAFEPHQLLKISLYDSSWESDPAPEDIAYTYTLTANDGQTVLSIAIGDFAKLPDGEKYYEASIEFAGTALQKIKELAEH